MRADVLADRHLGPAHRRAGGPGGPGGAQGAGPQRAEGGEPARGQPGAAQEGARSRRAASSRGAAVPPPPPVSLRVVSMRPAPGGAPPGRASLCRAFLHQPSRFGPRARSPALSGAGEFRAAPGSPPAQRPLPEPAPAPVPPGGTAAAPVVPVDRLLWPAPGAHARLPPSLRSGAGVIGARSGAAASQAESDGMRRHADVGLAHAPRGRVRRGPDVIVPTASHLRKVAVSSASLRMFSRATSQTCAAEGCPSRPRCAMPSASSRKR